MMSRALLFTAGLFAIISTAACKSPSNSSLKNIDGQCRVTISGKELFVGEQACMAELPQEELNGYWVVDHEYSTFYTDLASDKPAYDEEATWIDLSSAAASVAKPLIRPGIRQIFQIRFVGTRSNAPGIYGPSGFKSGAYVDRFISIKKIS